MGLSALLWIIMAWWQMQPHAYQVQSATNPGTVQSATLPTGAKNCFDKDVGHAVPCDAPPFDVPPVETDGPDGEYATDCSPSRGDYPGTCWQDRKVLVHHRACADKSRFLLMSEDSVWHCLALGKQ